MIFYENIILSILYILNILIQKDINMTDNKLYTVLTHFDKIAQNRLRKYVRSPYFNANETLMALFDIVINHINKISKGSDLTKEGIWQQLFPKETYNDTRFRKLFSDLLKLVEDFLAQEVYDDNKLQKTNNLLEAVSTKKLEKLFSSVMRNSDLAVEKQHYKSADYYYYKYLIEKNYYYLKEEDLKRSEISNVADIISSLDEFYLAEKIKWYASMLSRKSLVAHEYKLLFIDEIIEHIQKYGYEHNPIIAIYFQILLTILEKDEQLHYYKLIDLLDKHNSQFSQKDLYDFYVHGLNYCITKINQGDQKFLEEYHIIYKVMLEKEVIYYASSNQELSPWTFKNGILAALRLGHYEWAENYIRNYQHRLPEDQRRNAVSFNLANVYFYQKKYDKATQLLNSVEYEDIAYNLDSKSILLAMYYEQDEDEVLMSLLDSFKAYLYRHKDISDNKRIPYMNLMKYVRKLLKLNPGDKKEIAHIRKEMEEDRKVGIASEKWLLEKLVELE